MGFEPTTPTLARLCSTPELHPLTLIRGEVLSTQAAPTLWVRRLYGAWRGGMQQENWFKVK